MGLGWRLSVGQQGNITVKVLSGIIAFVLVCTLLGMDNMVSLISVTILIVLISQYIGIEKYKIEKKRRK